MTGELSQHLDGTPAPAASVGARRVDMILDRIATLPTLPALATRMLSIVSAQDVAMDEIARLIESDPAMAAKVLGLCRRADKGVQERITSVKRAVVMLGLSAVRSAVLSVSVFDALRGTPSEEGAGGFEQEGLWKHSVAVACAAELIASADKGQKVQPEEAFLAGLLHGVGRIALHTSLPRAYDRVVRLAEKQRVRSAGVERAQLGVDHHSAGRRLALHWQLPTQFQEAIWLHDQPRSAITGVKHQALVGVVTAARAVCRDLMLGWSGDFDAPLSPAGVWEELGVRAKMDEVCAALPGALAERLRVLGLEDASTPQILLESLQGAKDQLAQMNAALEDRVRASEGLARVVSAFAVFQGAVAADTTLTGVCGGIVRSAAELSRGAGYHAAVARCGEAWVLCASDEEGARDVDAPTAHATRTLASLPVALTGAASAGLHHWLEEVLAGTPDVGALRVCVLRDGQEAVRGVWVTDQSPVCDSDHVRLVARHWAGALGQLEVREEQARLNDELVASARALHEAQGRMAEREATFRLGQITAGAAHELNNPLTVIAGRAQLLQLRLADQRDKAAAVAIVAAARTMSDMVTSLHLLSNPPVVNAETRRVLEEVRGVVQKAKLRMCADAEVKVIAVGAPERFTTDHAMLGGALIELLANAIEACPNGPVTLTVAQENSGNLSLKVQDQGAGMGERALRHAFDPFYSERGAGRGRGLGLTRARVLVRALGGEITLSSSIGQGGGQGGGTVGGQGVGQGTLATISVPAMQVAAVAA